MTILEDSQDIPEPEQTKEKPRALTDNQIRKLRNMLPQGGEWDNCWMEPTGVAKEIEFVSGMLESMEAKEGDWEAVFGEYVREYKRRCRRDFRIRGIDGKISDDSGKLELE